MKQLKKPLIIKVIIKDLVEIYHHQLSGMAKQDQLKILDLTKVKNGELVILH